MAAETFPERKRREQTSQLDPYLAVIREQWALGCHNAASIYRTLRAMGYRGSYGSVYTLIARWRQGDPLSKASRGSGFFQTSHLAVSAPTRRLDCTRAGNGDQAPTASS